MNLASANLVSRSASAKAVETQAPSLPEKNSGSEEFANALKGQEQALKETKEQPEPPVQKQSASKEPPAAELQPGTDDQKELVAMLNKYLPQAKAGKESAAADPLPSLPVLTDGANAAAPILPPAEGILPNIPVDKATVPVPDMPPVEVAALTTTPADIAAPIVAPVDMAVTQDMGSALALTGLAFVKPMPDEAKINIPVESTATEISLPQKTVSGQAAQINPKISLASSDSVESFKQTLTAVTEPKSTAPEITPEMISMPQKPVDTRMETAVITKPLTHPGWSKDLGEQIIWMNNKDISAAEIKLNPAHLGPISVRIDINQDNQTSILFTALHAETKEALEASIPKLKEMLLGQQLNLVNVNISQNSNPNGRPPSQAYYGTPGSNNSGFESAPEPLGISESGHTVSKGLLSLYA
jgi:flagellar hook-length control protein FliK